MSYQFRWSVLWTGESGQWLLSGLITTLELSVLAWLLAAALGIVSGALRTVRFWPLRVVATFYVEFFRNVPLLVWMFFWYFAIPPLLPPAAQEWILEHGLEFWAAVCALGVYSGARFSEVLRSGIQSIPRTQLEASVASGLTTFQAYRYVILPVALRLIIPPGTNESLNLLKNSSVALTIGLLELTGRARSMQEFTFKVFEAFAAATVIYLLTNLVVVLLMRALEHRVRVPGFIGAGPQAPQAGH